MAFLNLDLRPVSKKIDSFVSYVDKRVDEMDLYTQTMLFCELSCLAYFSHNEVQDWAKKLNFLSVVAIENDGGLAYLFETETDLILSFRGSDNAQNRKTNFDLDLVKDGALAGKVHHGFLKLADKMINSFVTLLDANNCEKKVWVTGHSLGGAIAAIMAVKAERRVGPNVDGIVTFGQPKIGNHAYIKGITTPYYRWVNHEDIVSKLPMWLPHFGSLKYLNNKGDLSIQTFISTLFIFPSTQSIEDHDIVKYRAVLEKQKGKELNPSPMTFFKLIK
jgi:triacylglycerol lipase